MSILNAFAPPTFWITTPHINISMGRMLDVLHCNIKRVPQKKRKEKKSIRVNHIATMEILRANGFDLLLTVGEMCYPLSSFFLFL